MKDLPHKYYNTFLVISHFCNIKLKIHNCWKRRKKQSECCNKIMLDHRSPNLNITPRTPILWILNSVLQSFIGLEENSFWKNSFITININIIVNKLILQNLINIILMQRNLFMFSNLLLNEDNHYYHCVCWRKTSNKTSNYNQHNEIIIKIIMLMEYNFIAWQHNYDQVHYKQFIYNKKYRKIIMLNII